MISLTLSGNPLPAPRPRVVNGRAYNPPGYTSQKKAWRWEAHIQMMEARAEMLTGRVGMNVRFHRSDRRTADIDNMLKSVADSLNGIAFEDDRQIDQIHATVHRGVGKDNARTEVELWELDA